MVSDKAFATEFADVQQALRSRRSSSARRRTLRPVLPCRSLPERPKLRPADEDENVDLEAVLGGNIKKAPAAATVDEPEAGCRPNRRIRSGLTSLGRT